MTITDVQIQLARPDELPVLAYVSVTLGGEFVVKELKLLDNGNGPFVAMPQRPLRDRCPSCDRKGNVAAKFCAKCGAALGENRSFTDPRGRRLTTVDVCHPITADCRAYLEAEIGRAYRAKLEAAELASHGAVAG